MINAEYWLCFQLETFSKSEDAAHKIVEAYKYLVSRIIAYEGAPKLLSRGKNISYSNYILFDNINKIFCKNNMDGYHGLTLIRSIYESLNELLSVDPNYMHQRAKCYIKSAYFEKNKTKKEKFLEKAYRDANVSLQTFQLRYEKYYNEKLLISMAHVEYTKALILCHKCELKQYANKDENSNAIELLYSAFSSPHNSYAYAKRDAFNYNDAIGKIITRTMADSSLIKSE